MSLDPARIAAIRAQLDDVGKSLMGYLMECVERHEAPNPLVSRATALLSGIEVEQLADEHRVPYLLDQIAQQAQELQVVRDLVVHWRQRAVMFTVRENSLIGDVNADTIMKLADELAFALPPSVPGADQ